MDHTKKNIEMCEKAKELQKNHKWKPGDTFYFKGYKSAVTFIPVEKVQVFDIDEDHVNDWWDCIWLPRQDDLQEIVKEKCIARMTSRCIFEGENLMLMAFYHWAMFSVAAQMAKGSLEQLWLGFVMHEKYNKAWNGKEWIKEA